MNIPSYVKIGGRRYNVKIDDRGSVMIGDVFEEMNDNIRRKLNSLSYEEHLLPWNKEMYRLFEKCLTKARNIYG